MENRFSQRLTIIGTTHVDKSSIERVRRIIFETRPSVVVVELDEERLLALRDADRDRLYSPFHSGVLPWLLALLERVVGSMTHVFPGTEMLEAVEEAERVGAQTVLIDKPISTILDQLRDISLSEKLRIVTDVLVALVGMSVRWKSARLVGTDLEKLMAEFDLKYPTMSRILVKERDEYMAGKLTEIMNSHAGRVIAVVGLGHVKGIGEHLGRLERQPSPSRSELRYEWSVGTS